MKTKNHRKILLTSGYTIIEILIVIFILVIIFSVTSANLRGYSQEKTLVQAEKQVQADLKLAQGYALAGKLLSGCEGLNGYVFTSAETTYTMTADCVTDVNLPNKTNISLPSGIRFTSAQNILFKVLGKGTNLTPGTFATFTLQQDTTGKQRQIRVNSAGLIE